MFRITVATRSVWGTASTYTSYRTETGKPANAFQWFQYFVLLSHRHVPCGDVCLWRLLVAQFHATVAARFVHSLHVHLVSRVCSNTSIAHLDKVPGPGHSVSARKCFMGKEHRQCHAVAAGAAKWATENLGKDKDAWERLVFMFAQREQLPALGPYVPVSPRLSQLAYTAVAAAYVPQEHNHAELARLLHRWPQPLLNDIAEEVTQIISHRIQSSHSPPSVDIQRSLARLLDVQACPPPRTLHAPPRVSHFWFCLLDHTSGSAWTAARLGCAMPEPAPVYRAPAGCRVHSFHVPSGRSLREEVQHETCSFSSVLSCRRSTSGRWTSG